MNPEGFGAILDWVDTRVAQSTFPLEHELFSVSASCLEGPGFIEVQDRYLADRYVYKRWVETRSFENQGGENDGDSSDDQFSDFSD